MKNEIQVILSIAHAPNQSVGVKHNGINSTLESLTNNKLYWAGIKNDVEDFIANCTVCIEEKYEKTCSVPKIILSNGPLDRVVIDLWQIPKDMISAFQSNVNNQYRYILLCVDHFSKYTWGVLINNKEAETIVENLEIILTQFKAPNILQHDNGKEFDNQLVRDFCKRSRIKIIKSSVCHPQSQGAVEKLNDFMHKSLRTGLRIYRGKEKEYNVNSWNIELALKAFINYRNNKNHFVTRIKPNNLILSENQSLILTVKDRIQKHYEKRNKSKSDIIITVGMKVFIIGNIQKQKNREKLIPAKRKKLNKNSEQAKFKKIPAIVIDTSDLNKNKVKIKVCGKPRNDSLGG